LIKLSVTQDVTSIDLDVWTVTDKGYEISDEHIVEFGKASSAKAKNFCLNTLLRIFLLISITNVPLIIFGALSMAFISAPSKSRKRNTMC
jgi:hypothetical protein